MKTPHEIRDPLYGQVFLSDEELALTELPEFQRLKNISAFGAVHVLKDRLKQPVPSLYDHAIGSLHQLSQVVIALRDDREHRKRFDETMCRLLRITQLIWQGTGCRAYGKCAGGLNRLVLLERAV